MRTTAEVAIQLAYFFTHQTEDPLGQRALTLLAYTELRKVPAGYLRPDVTDHDFRTIQRRPTRSAALEELVHLWPTALRVMATSTTGPDRAWRQHEVMDRLWVCLWLMREEGLAAEAWDLWTTNLWPPLQLVAERLGFNNVPHLEICYDTND